VSVNSHCLETGKNEGRGRMPPSSSRKRASKIFSKIRAWLFPLTVVSQGSQTAGLHSFQSLLARLVEQLLNQSTMSSMRGNFEMLGCSYSWSTRHHCESLTYCASSCQRFTRLPCHVAVTWEPDLFLLHFGRIASSAGCRLA